MSIKRVRLRGSTLAPLLLAGTFLAEPGAAQPGQLPSQFQTVDENGVDLMTREFKIDREILAIGDGPAQLKLRLLGNGAGVWHNFNGWASYADDGIATWFASVNFEHDMNTFASLGQNIPSEQGDGATLTTTGTEFIWTQSDGTVVIFNRTVAPSGASGGFPTQIIYPGGHKIRIYYKTIEGVGPRIQSVTNNHGYQLKLNYPSATSQLLSSAQAINNAVDHCDPTADSCTSLSQAWPMVTISHSNPGSWPNVVTVTNSLNETLRYSFTMDSRGDGSTYSLAGIKEPGRTVDNITFAGGNSGAANDIPLVITRDGVTYTYSWSWVPGYWPELTRTGLLGQVLATRRVDGGLRPEYFRDGLNRITAFTYDPNMRLTRVTQPEGNYVQYSYDARGNLTETRRVTKPGTWLADIVTGASYSVGCANPLTCNKPITTTDAKGGVTDYSYDGQTGQVLSVTLPAPTTGGVRPQARFGYTARQAYYKNGSGAVVAGEPVSLLTGISACQTLDSCTGTADEVTTTIDYGPQSAGTANNLHVASITAGSGNGALTATTSFGYDSLGNLITVDGPAAGPADTTRLRYDAVGRRVGSIGPDPDGADPTLKHLAVRTSYNGDGQVTKEERGTVNSQSDPDWAAMTVYDSVDLTYDTNGRPIKTTQGAGGSVLSAIQFSYDSAGRPDCTATRMNPDIYASLPASACSLGSEGSFGPDRIVKYSYDAVARVTEIRSALNTAAEAADAISTYRPNGQLWTLTDGENNKTTFEYDGHDRLKRTYLPSPTQGAGASNPADFEEYGYDPNGNVTTRRLRDGYSLNFAYDALNRMTVKTVPERPGLAATHTRDIYNGYDLLNRPTFARFDSAAGEGVSFSWNALGRLVSSTTDMGGNSRQLSYEYDARGNRTRITHPPAIVPTHAYLGLKVFLYDYHYDWLDRPVSITNGGGAEISGWTYDVQGRLAQINRAAVPPTVYGYDAASRVSSITYDLYGQPYDMTLGYTYNPAGQVISRSANNDLYASTASYNVVRPYASNGLNQYSSAGPASFVYDANGNLTGDGSSTFVYDVENRLVSASGARNAALLYDPLGRLHQVSGSSGWLQFLYDGDALVAEYDGALTRPHVYVHGVGTDVPMVWYDGGGGGRRIYADHQGSVVAIAHPLNGYLAINAYDEWGIPNAANKGRFQYTGQIWLPELGMYYYKARLYSPTLGRFMQTDPIGYGDGMNRYAYVGNDPVNRRDPFGLNGCGMPDTAPTAYVCGFPGRSIGHVMALWDYLGGTNFAFAADEKGEGGEPREKPGQGNRCPAVPASRPVGTRGQVGASTRDPEAAFVADAVRELANDAAASRFPSLSGHNDVRDAYRHFYWAYGMARIIGSDRALRITNAHEAEYPDNPRDEQAMDTWNNAVALAMVGDPRYAAMPTAEVAEIALKNGCLRVLR